MKHESESGVLQMRSEGNDQAVESGRSGAEAWPSRTVSSRRLFAAVFLVALCAFAGCREEALKQTVQALSLRDVPAQRLSYRFEADTPAPAGAETAEETKLPPVQTDFDTRRKTEVLIRTVPSPDRQRALALYETSDDSQGSFRIDMYAADGKFLRNLTPSDLSGAFRQAVAWSPDGNNISFIGRRSIKAQPTPAPTPGLDEAPPETPTPNPTVAPNFGPVAIFDTEQVYVCDRDGFNLKPLTNREGLIYFYAAWAPDGHALVSLACKEDEWDAREKDFRPPAGRPRLIGLDGRERLLDDAATDAEPVWCPDSSKVATAFDTDVAIYDALPQTPTGARIPLREALLTASTAYDEKNLQTRTKRNEGQGVKGGEKPPAQAETTHLPVSFNSIVQLDWLKDDTLLIQTAYVRTLPSQPVRNFPRWHTLHLGAQSATLKSSR
jgi:hypothetical protein